MFCKCPKQMQQLLSWNQLMHLRKLKISGDDDDEEEGDDGEEKMPACGDYIMHFLTLPWKLIFALIPPTCKITNQTYKNRISQNKNI